MNNPMPWLDTRISEPSIGGRHYGDLTPPAFGQGVSGYDAFWQAQLLSKAQETSTWVLVKTAGIKSQKNRSVHVRISEIGDLEADWDGDDALAIDPLIVQSAHEVLEALPGQIQADASPNPNGTISLFLSTDGRSAELEIGRTRYAWAAFRDGNSQASASQSGSVEDLLTNQGIAALLTALGEATPKTRIATPVHLPRERPMAGGGVRFDLLGLRTLEPAF